MEKRNVLVTGGTGYIGSHTVVELVKANYNVIIVDNLVNSKIDVLRRIEIITGVKVKFYQGDVQDKKFLENVFKNEHITDVIHFAGLKAVGESVKKPLLYYQNNLLSTIILLDVMEEFNVKNIVFSSSATVYGTPKHVPLSEIDPVGGVTNPYGATKLINEEILEDEYKTSPSMNIALLRYFNPIGAHESGLLGEDPNGIPNNLMPYITQVAIGKLKVLGVYGNDYDTVDGTGVRDYIHVVDLAIGHTLALKKFEENPGLVIYNLGTGKGTSVLELVHAFEEATGITIPYVIKERRAGDVAINYASTKKALKELGFKAKYDIIDACRDSWNFQKKNPDGIK